MPWNEAFNVGGAWSRSATAWIFSTAWPREDQDLGTIFTRAHDAGAIVMHMVPTLDDAERAASAGADVIVAQGTEGGGHVGLMGTAVIVRQVAKAVAPIPDDPPVLFRWRRLLHRGGRS